MQVAKLIQEATFKIRTFEEAEQLADFLSEICPNIAIARMGLLELFTNAIEHGNLKIGSDEKSKLQKEDRWLAEISKRLKLPENKDKRVTVHVQNKPDEFIIKVTDEGDGFDWKKFHQKQTECSKASHGRGILLAKELAFTQLIYSEKGNEVTGIIDLS